MNAETLPNQRTTWAKLSSAVEEFDAWKQRTDRRYASEDAELLCYLTDQLQAEGASLADVQMNHPVLGLLSHMSESNNRMRELLLAYLSLAVTGDSQPAKKLIAGQRLCVGLHHDYVAATSCYGRQIENRVRLAEKEVYACLNYGGVFHDGEPTSKELELAYEQGDLSEEVPQMRRFAAALNELANALEAEDE